jgi:hypothetical protein
VFCAGGKPYFSHIWRHISFLFHQKSLTQVRVSCWGSQSEVRFLAAAATHPLPSVYATQGQRTLGHFLLAEGAYGRRWDWCHRLLERDYFSGHTLSVAILMR